jgi:DNA replication protein DnaC
MTQLLKKFKDCSFENFKTENKEQEALVRYLKDCLRNGFKENIALMGSVGTGKTHLAYAIVNALEEIRVYGNAEMYTANKVNITTIKSMIDNLRTSWRREADEIDSKIVSSYSKIPLLIIDEVGVQYGTESERVELFEIFNTRYGNELPTMIISNCTKEQISKFLGQRIIDRLFGGAKVFELTGNSKR